jgi:hypothetical protein
MGHSLNDKSFVINDKLIIDSGSANNIPGYVLISDSKGNAKWKNPSGWANPSAPLERFVGELYGGGVVVATWREVRAETRSGFYELCLIASVKNAGTGNRWSSVTDLAIGATAQNFSFGASCSLAIVGQDVNVIGAARDCLNYVNESLGGLGVYDDWYLPSAFELNCLSNNAAIFNRVVSQYATDKSIVGTSYSLFLNSDSAYWTSNESNGTGDGGNPFFNAIALRVGSGGALLAPVDKSSFLKSRPFRTDVRRWDETDGTWSDILAGTGTFTLNQYEYMIATYYYSFNDNPSPNRDLDTCSYLTGTGIAALDNNSLGCNYDVPYPVGQGLKQSSYIIGGAGATQGSAYVYWAGDDSSNGKGESILLNFKNLKNGQPTSNANVAVNLHASFHRNTTYPSGNVVAVEITTYVGGSLSTPSPNTIASSGTVVQRLRSAIRDVGPVKTCGGLSPGITGTISLTSGSATVIGTSTLFTTQVQAGDIISFYYVGVVPAVYKAYTVSSVSSNTSLTLTSNSTVSVSGQTALVSRNSLNYRPLIATVNYNLTTNVSTVTFY